MRETEGRTEKEYLSNAVVIVIVFASRGFDLSLTLKGFFFLGGGTGERLCRMTALLLA